MTGFLFVVLIVFLFIVNNNINTKFKKLGYTIDSLNERIKHLQNKIVSQERIIEKKKETIVEQSKISKPLEDIIKPVTKKPQVITSKEEKIIKPIPDSTTKIYSPVKEKPIPSRPKVKQLPKKSWIETFKDKNPDLEKFIGENLINKIGVLILVLGISFFVKYAIDKDWINESARVGIGILCGALVMGIAHKLKKNYAAFSSVLVAGAISIFYFTIYIAFHEYQLFTQTIAFIIMAIITAFSALVSVSYNRQELAVLSLIGGFAAPFMLSTGEGNYVVLFSYIAILDIGMLVISYFKKWKIATILAFVFTMVLFNIWCLVKIGDSTFSHAGALTFATLFYFIFSITIVLNNLRNKGVFSTIEYFILVANTFFFFGIGMTILKSWDSNFTGLFTLLLAVYNIVYAAILYKKFGLDKNAIYLLIGLALTFVTLTIPIQFEGNQITLFWAAEAVLLLWLSQKSKISAFKLGAIIVQVLTLVSLALDWRAYNATEALSIILNPVYIAGLVVSVSLFITYWLLKKESDIKTKFFTLDINFYKTAVLISAIVITYITGILEVNYQAFQFLENHVSALSFPVTYHFIFVAILLFLSSRFKHTLVTKGLLLISSISILLYIIKFYAFPNNEMIENFVNSTTTKYAFYFHYIILGCLIYFGYQLFRNASLLFKTNQNKWLAWVFAFAIVYVLSNEIMVHGLHFTNASINVTELAEKFPDSDKGSYSKGYFIEEQVDGMQAQISKIGYPILWGIFSFVFLIIGIKKQWKNLRIIALSLLGLTIVKLFVYDIKNVSETGKIIAFILLGVLILVISFVYQKVKKLIIDETLENENDHENI